MKTNELKKGDTVILNNGWKAEIMDNKKGNIRLAKVFGDFTEMGSIYAHDIIGKIGSSSECIEIEHTQAQINLRETVSNLF